ncbi:hypothetical protein Btru_006645 [Bulinus truncatus]|nr:hypothetical protein Btru_006645 [Bulinus truncatus]
MINDDIGYQDGYVRQCVELSREVLVVVRTLFSSLYVGARKVRLNAGHVKKNLTTPNNHEPDSRDCIEISVVIGGCSKGTWDVPDVVLATQLTWLIKKKVWLDKAENFVMAALFCASEEGNVDGLKELSEMAANIDFNTANKHGETAVHMAASGGHVDVLKFLLSKGVDISTRDKDGIILDCKAPKLTSVFYRQDKTIGLYSAQTDIALMDRITIGQHSAQTDISSYD